MAPGGPEQGIVEVGNHPQIVRVPLLKTIPPSIRGHRGQIELEVIRGWLQECGCASTHYYGPEGAPGGHLQPTPKRKRPATSASPSNHKRCR